MSRSCSLKAPAKINLGLRIGKQRADGFHRLKTLFQTVSWFDELRVEAGPEFSEDRLTVEGPEAVPEGEENLVRVAINQVRDRCGSLPGVHVSLTKRIPVGTGLGGGSSDAASTLMALRHLFPSRVDRDVCMSIAADLGADVPFFLHGGTMLGEGIGDQLSDVEDLSGVAVVVVPSYRVDTEWAYQRYAKGLSDSSNLNNINFSIKSRDGREALSSLDLTNDFEPLVADRYDRHRSIREVLRGNSLGTALTGSGSALYSLHASDEQATECRERVAREFSGVTVRKVRFVGSQEYPLKEGE
jgi:4-diphosphocytidyl-2-C-methyl-D-erythritol kinase